MMRPWSRFTRRRLSFLVLVCLVAMLFYTVFPWKRQINVHVVEEHREALPYWIKASKEGVIPTSGNILVHIDGRANQDLPRTVAGMPLFRAANSLSPSDTHTFLQSNEAVIQSAVSMGLVSRVIWIYPSWDPNILSKTLYSRRDVQLGWIHKDKDSKSKEMCSCVVDQTGYPDCINQKNEQLGPDACNVVTTYVSEYIHEDEVLRMTMDPTWIPLGSSIILDLDEHFFGCELGAAPLLEADIEWQVIEEINNRLEEFVCPLQSQEEAQVDDLLKNLILLFHRVCTWPDDADNEDNARCQTPHEELLASTQSDIIDVWKDEPLLFCADKDTSIIDTWHRLLKVFLLFSKLQLEALINIGFCYKHSPTSYGFVDFEKGQIGICHGSMRPNDTSPYLYSSTDPEVQQRAAQLELVLNSPSLADNTKIATLARSVREGYTLRDQVDYIEEELLNAIVMSHPPGKVEVLYDTDLLGGAWGWSSRPRPSLMHEMDF